MSAFIGLSRPALLMLANALETSRLTLPTSEVSLCSYVPKLQQNAIIQEINHLHQQGMPPGQIAYLLKMLAEERATFQAKQDQVALVWTGPEVSGTESRDTGVVVRELFSSAQKSVLIASFAVDKGDKGHELFRPLAQRMDRHPNLQVRMFLNVKRKYQDTTPTSTLLRNFSETFRHQVWPGKRLPEVFYDPRAMEMTSNSNACLHAKCVVVDEERFIITSANFTEAAHARNIEAGVLMSNPILAKAIRSQFEMLVTHDIMERVPGI